MTESLCNVSGSPTMIDGRWREVLKVENDGKPIAGADQSTWKLSLAGPDTLEIKSGDGISIEQQPNQTLMLIDYPVAGVVGDYKVDLHEERADGETVHWLSGSITFGNEAF